MYESVILPWLTIFAWAVALTSLSYLLLAVLAVWRRPFRPERAGELADSAMSAVSILKPLCGDEPDLYRNLASFCNQEYPRYQLVFGVMDEGDPALETVRRLRRDYPNVDMAVVIDPSQVGANRKVSNLSNMMKMAKHDFIVISDSDISVTPRYLGTIIRELLSPGVGLVTCLYRSRSGKGLFSRLGAMYLNEWFLPSVLVGRFLGYHRFSFGSTIAIRRDVLEAVGGLSVAAGQLADDYRLGELVRRQGLRTSLSSYVVTNSISEETMQSLSLHELRWARTIRAVQPVGYAFSVITHSIPVCVLLLLVLWGSVAGWVFLGVAVILRMALHALTVRSLRSGRLWESVLVPLRDALTFCIFCASFTSNRISWRTNQFSLRSDGSLHAWQKVKTP